MSTKEDVKEEQAKIKAVEDNSLPLNENEYRDTANTLTNPSKVAAELTDDEPKLTVKLRSEITEPEPAEFTLIKPTEPIVEQEQPLIASEDEEERFEETESADTAKVEERKPKSEKIRKSKVTRKAPAKKERKLEDKSVSQLQSELRKHSDARKKTDSAILGIKKEIKDLLLIHHAAIKDLQKQVEQMHKKIATIDSSRKSIMSRTIAKKTASGRKTTGRKKSKKSNKIRKKSRRR